MSAPLPEVLRRRAKAALFSGELKTAAGLISQLEELEPLALPSRCLRAELHLRMGHNDTARAAAAQLVLAHPDSPRAQYLAGWSAYRNKQWTVAEAHFRESNLLHPAVTSRAWIGKSLTAQRRFDEAEAILVDVVGERPSWATDLAWLYECKGEPERALSVLDRHAEALRGSQYAAADRARLRAKVTAPEELVEELEVLAELGEEVGQDVLPSTLVALIDTGRVADARALVVRQIDSLDARTATSAGWAVYRRQAWDLAFDLFVVALPTQRSNVKFLNAFELTARNAGQIPKLLDLYEIHASFNPRLFGRIRKVHKRLAP